MIAATEEELQTRVMEWITALGIGEIVAGESTVGGGSLPGQVLPTVLLVLPVSSPTKFMALLRGANPAVIGRIQEDRVVLDPRTVLPEQDEKLINAIKSITSHEDTGA
jgi:L-seryl-tRNA(Ser) seleniumtransferase